MSSWRAWTLFCFTAACAWLGCSDEHAALRCGDHACSSACAELSGAACDVLEPSCRERVLAALRCVRGSAGVLPQIRTLSAPELRAELLDASTRGVDARDAESEASMPDDQDARVDDVVSQWLDAGTPTRAPAEEADPWKTALGLLGLLPQDADAAASAELEDSADSIAGYYDSQEQRITLIDRGTPQNEWSQVGVFAHELVHALQDQTLGLGELADRGPASYDGRFARGCLIEGDAELYEALGVALLQGLTFDDEYFAARQRAIFKYDRRNVLDSPAPYSTLWHLRYPIGASYLYSAFRAGGNWGVQRLFEAPPTSTIHWLVGYDANLARREPLVLPLACDRAAIPPGYSVYWQGSMGAAVLYALLGHTLVSDGGVLRSEAQWQNALHWRQDSLSIFEGPADAVALSYRVRFDDAEVAKQLARDLRHNDRIRLEIAQHDDELELLTAQDATVLPSLGTDPSACPEPP